MSAALEVEVWDDREHPVNLDGTVGRAELARGCGDLWASALGVYYTDCGAAMRGKGAHADKGEALEDLTGDRRLLEALCEPIGADPHRVGDAMIEALDAGRRFSSNAMHRPVPEIHDDLRLGQWRERTKRRGKPEALTLG